MEKIINFLKFIFLPIVTEIKIIGKIALFLKKIIIKCCKRVENMISCTCKKLSKITKSKKKNNIINKRGFFNGFKQKEKIKKSEYKLD